MTKFSVGIVKHLYEVEGDNSKELIRSRERSILKRYHIFHHHLPCRYLNEGKVSVLQVSLLIMPTLISNFSKNEPVLARKYTVNESFTDNSELPDPAVHFPFI